MLRSALTIILLAAAALVAGLIAETPGTLTLQWQDVRVDTSVAVFAVLIVVLVVVLMIVWRLISGLIRLPAWLSGSERERRRRRGYEALSRGLVAIAAGDVGTARRQAQRAEALLEKGPLTLLVAAQAAQLEGNDEAATKLFTQLMERPQTEMLGLRGLLTQAMKREAWEDALSLARRAYRIDDKSPWVVETLFSLQKRLGQWVEADRTLGQQAKLRLLPQASVQAERAGLFYQKSREVDGEEAQRWAREALKADPSFTPASVRLARLLTAAGRQRKARQVIEQAWARHPDADLVDPYFEASECHDAMAKVRAAERLARENPSHAESKLALAVAAIEARQWSDARAALYAAGGDNPGPRVCKLMAALEEAEHGDLVSASSWLRRAMGEEKSGLPAAAIAVEAGQSPASSGRGGSAGPAGALVTTP
ncbi:MAG: hypothetical protein MUE49_03140 [Rhodospirillales bacterium]|nr:hypothetical protein [Rhodospirillales bacterium]